MLDFGAPPKLMAGDPSALGHGFQLCPHDGRMNAPVELLLGKAAIGAGDHVFAAHEPDEPHDALGHKLGMFHDVCTVADDAGCQNLAGRQLHILPNFPLVFVARVRRLDQVGPGTNLENEVDDLLEWDIRRVRSGQLPQQTW